MFRYIIQAKKATWNNLINNVFICMICVFGLLPFLLHKICPKWKLLHSGLWNANIIIHNNLWCLHFRIDLTCANQYPKKSNIPLKINPLWNLIYIFSLVVCNFNSFMTKGQWYVDSETKLIPLKMYPLLHFQYLNLKFDPRWYWC